MLLLSEKVPPSKELSIDIQFVVFVFLIVIIVSSLEEKVAPSKELSIDILFVVVISIKKNIALRRSSIERIDLRGSKNGLSVLMLAY